MKNTAHACVIALFLAACHVSPETQVASSNTKASVQEADAASRTVDALVAAVDAQSSGDIEGMRRAVMALNALGSHGQDAESEALLAGWRASLPDEGLPMRGRALGPGFRAGEVAAGSAVRLEQTFFAGQRAMMAVRTHGGGKVAVRVIDGREKTLCASQGKRVRCRWTPIYTQRHEIIIRNTDGGKVRYFISFT